MEFKVLVDNTQGDSDQLQAEHGLSFWFQADGEQWLLDVGASSRFAENAALLGVDVAAADHLLLSHAHADHTGGLSAFSRANDTADIYLSSHIDGRHFYSTRRGSCRDISIDYALLDQLQATRPGRVHYLSRARQLSPAVSILTDIPLLFPQPRANATLYTSAASGSAGAQPVVDALGAAPAASTAAVPALVQDDFSHEMVVLVMEPEGATVLSSCSHKGILNTLAAAREALAPTGLPIRAYIGGLHLVDSDESHHFETQDDLIALGETLLRDYPELTVFTGHCTGPTAISTLQQVMGSRLVKFYTGFKADSLA